MKKLYFRAQKAGLVKPDPIIISLAAILVFISRWPLKSQMLYDWDAVQFALALSDYDVPDHQPHPPGYIFLVGLAKALNYVFNDPNFSYIALNIILSTFTVAILYLLARTMFDRWVGVVSGLTFLFCRIFWFYGEITSAYIAEAFISVTIAYLSYQFLMGDKRSLYPSAIALGLAGGIRQTAEMLLLPLWCFALVYQKKLSSKKELLVALVLLLCSTLSWYLPTIWLNGGWEEYSHATYTLWRGMVEGSSIFFGANLSFLHRLGNRTQVWILRDLYLFPLLLLGYLLLNRKRMLSIATWEGKKILFLAIWILCPLSFYLCFHLPKEGYLLTFLPPVYITFSYLVVNLARRVHQLTGYLNPYGLIGIFLAYCLIENFGAFLYPKHPEFQLSYKTIEARDKLIAEEIRFIRSHYSPTNTALITEWGNENSRRWLRHVMYYLPEYHIFEITIPQTTTPNFIHLKGHKGINISFAHYEKENLIPAQNYIHSSSLGKIVNLGLPNAIDTLVWVIDSPDTRFPRPAWLQDQPMPSGRCIYVAKLGDQPLYYNRYKIYGNH